GHVDHQDPAVQLEMLGLQANLAKWGRVGLQVHLVSVSVVQKGSKDLMDYLGYQ
ncbi:hypothetical protein M9458_030810, partial [Cirrhinus mrigala]